MSLKKQLYKHIYVEDGKKVVENTELQNSLLFLYFTIVGRFLRLIVRLKVVSVLYGWYQSSFLSIFKIKKFIKKHNLIMHDFIEPVGGYTSFNDFFCRSLKPGARHIDLDIRSLISPADAKCWTLPEVSTQASFFVKQQKFSLQTLLKDKEKAAYFDRGVLFLLRLAPYDYHRFHAPIDGDYSQYKRINGVLEAVNPIAFKGDCMPLLENKRDLIMVKSKEFDCSIAIMPVGAMLVGDIRYSAQLPATLNKGDELGYFAFGGSTVLVLLPPGVVTVRADLTAYTARGFEVVVKMGEQLATFIA